MSKPDPAVPGRLISSALGSLQHHRPPSPRESSRIAQCTHMTTTRVYNLAFRCTICLQPGEFGWLYRCTQDRELILGDDLEKGSAPSIDKLPTILPRQQQPPKRGHVLRANELSFFDEVNEEQLRSYSPQQIEIILAQRTHAQKIANQSEPLKDFFQGLQILEMPKGAGISSSLFSPEFEGYQFRKGIPVVECQFKACHKCRWHLSERSWLSLDAVADGEIPPTALTGFGFHFQGSRPVTQVKHVLNLGLRPNPPATPTSKLFSNEIPRSPLNSKARPWAPIGSLASPTEFLSPFVDENNADTTFGQAGSNAYDSAAMTRKLNADIESPPTPDEHDVLFQKAFRMIENKLVANNNATPVVSALRKTEKDTVANNLKDTSEHGSSAANLRTPWTPPVSPSLKPTGEDQVASLDLNKGIDGTSNQILRTNLPPCGHYVLNSTLAHHNGEVGLLMPVTNTELESMAASPLPPSTLGELASPYESTTNALMPKSASVEIAESDVAFNQ